MKLFHASAIESPMRAAYAGGMPKPDDMMTAFGKRLRQARTALGWSTGRDFARALDELETTVSMWERGERIPRPTAMRKIKQKTGITMDWLLFGDDRGLTVEIARRLKADDTPNQ